VLDHLRLLVAATDLPVNADFENGFADDPETVARNVVLAAETGVAGVSIEDWSGERMYQLPHAVDRLAAAREALDPSVLLIGRNEHFRVPGMSVAESVKRAVAYSEAGADCLFVPFLLDPGAVKELVDAVAPKPLNVVVGTYDESIAALANLGVRRCSVGASLAYTAWTAFDAAAAQLRAQDPAE
jgi:2-methylisocitrate lyase-like PEP mutase family enzyme